MPGTEVSRYGRKWKLSARAESETGLWAGHMGFVKEGELSTLEWDEATKDFVRGEASSGVVVPFLISVEDRLVSFQLFSGEVRQTTVTSNLQSLLNAEGTHYWAIRPVSFRRTFEEWLRSVNHVSSFSVLLTYPNPNWTGREKVEGLVEGLRAERVRIQANASEGRTIDIQSDWFRQAMDHVRFGYGRADVAGPEKGTGTESHFVETSKGGAIPVINRVPAEEDAYEVTVDDLAAAQVQLVESHPQDIVVVDTDEGPDNDTAT